MAFYCHVPLARTGRPPMLPSLSSMSEGLLFLSFQSSPHRNPAVPSGSVYIPKFQGILARPSQECFSHRPMVAPGPTFQTQKTFIREGNTVFPPCKALVMSVFGFLRAWASLTWFAAGGGEALSPLPHNPPPQPCERLEGHPGISFTLMVFSSLHADF